MQSQRSAVLKEAVADSKIARDFAQGQFNLARLMLMREENGQAQQILADATTRFEKLTSDHPTDRLLWQRFIECLLTNAIATDNFSSLELAADYLRQLSMLSPNNRSYRLGLIDLYLQAMDMALERGRVIQAETWWRASSEQLFRRFGKEDQQRDLLLRQIELDRLEGLISLGKGNEELGKSQLQKALARYDAFGPAADPALPPSDSPNWRAVREFCRARK